MLSGEERIQELRQRWQESWHFPLLSPLRKHPSETLGERKGERLWKGAPAQPCHLLGAPLSTSVPGGAALS